MDPKACVWLQSQPAVGYVEFPHWKLLEKLIDWGYAQEDPDSEEGWDAPGGFKHLGEVPERLKYLHVRAGAVQLAAAYVPRESGPSFFLEVSKQTSEEELGRAAGELFRVSRILPATRHFIRGVRWCLEMTGVDDDELGRWLKRTRRKARRTRRSLKKALSADQLRASNPLPDGWAEPRKGWTIELADLDESALRELGPRLQVGDFSW